MWHEFVHCWYDWWIRYVWCPKHCIFSGETKTDWMTDLLNWLDWTKLACSRLLLIAVVVVVHSFVHSFWSHRGEWRWRGTRLYSHADTVTFSSFGSLCFCCWVPLLAFVIASVDGESAVSPFDAAAAAAASAVGGDTWWCIGQADVLPSMLS